MLGLFITHMGVLAKKKIPLGVEFSKEHELFQSRLLAGLLLHWFHSSEQKKIMVTDPEVLGQIRSSHQDPETKSESIL